MRTIVIVDGSGVIVNRVVVGDGDWSPPDGCAAVEEIEPMEIGGTYIEGVYTPLPRPEPLPDPLPFAVSAAQGRLALLGAGLLASVEAAVDHADEATQIWFEYATEWRRDHPILAALAAQLGMTESDVDDLFRTAAGL